MLAWALLADAGVQAQALDEPVLLNQPLPPAADGAACPGGYFSAVVDDGYGANLHSGIFGMELRLAEPGDRLLQGGLNFGALLDAGQVGFAGFNIANPRGEMQRLPTLMYWNQQCA